MVYKENCEIGGIRMCRPCGLDGKNYIHGSKVLKNDLAMQCVNGKWMGKVNQRP